MPELAEVEVGRRLAERVAVGRRIVRVACMEDELVFDGVPAPDVAAALTGAEVRGAHRHGKHLWLSLDRRPWPLFHFGMTGAFRAPGASPVELESGIRDAAGQWPPRFTKIQMFFDDDGELVMTNARRLGRIRLRQDPENEPPISGLGFDPYTDLPPLKAFLAGLRRRKIPLKALLLDQGFAAGVGNWLADEIAFQARLDPRRPAQDLSHDEGQRLHKAMRNVVRTAVQADADKTRFPKTWLFHHRWGKKAGAKVRGHLIEFITIGGRTTAWVPDLQR